MAVAARPKYIFYAVLCLLAVNTIALAQNAAGWLSLQAKDVQIIGNAPESDLRSAGMRLDEFRQALAALFPRLKTGDRPLRILVFPDQAAYTPFKPKRTDGTADGGVLGYFAAGDDVDYIALAADKHSEPSGTLLHEYTHAFVRANFEKKLPPWLDEGLAEYFETTRLTSDHTVILGTLQNDHLRLIRKNGLQPLPAFFAADSSSINRGSEASRELFYAQAWLTIHYLFHSGRLTPENLAEKITALTADANVNERTLRDTIGLDYAGLENELKIYIEQKTLPTLTVELPHTVSPSTPPATATVSDASASAYLGDLLFHLDNVSAAEAYLKKALALDPNSATANGILGRILMEQDKTAEALKYLDKAVAAGTTDHLALFQYAYALNLMNADEKGEISRFSPEVADKMRDALRRAINADPDFAESYRLLAFTYFVNSDDLEQAASLMRQAIALKPGDAEYELLLAQILLGQEKYADAKPFAESVVKVADKPKIRVDAEEILRAIDEYNRAKSVAPTAVDLRLSNFVLPKLVFLKRSWITEADLQQIEKDRTNANINRFLIRPEVGEKQIVGRIAKVTCKDADITYNVATEGGPLLLTSKGFQNLRMTVLTEGESSFEVGCDAHLEKQLAVINYQQPAGLAPTARGIISAISFVPDDFRLKTLDELAAARTVVIDDDTLRRDGGRVLSGGPEVDRSESRMRSIANSLRSPEKGELRGIGTIDKIECSGSKMLFQVSSGGRKLMLTGTGSDLKIAWFTVSSSQLPLVCGAGPLNSNTVLTYRQRTDPSSGVDGELRSIEFVPEGFILK